MPVFQKKGRTAVPASLHACGITSSPQQCTGNERKQPASGLIHAGQWGGCLVVRKRAVGRLNRFTSKLMAVDGGGQLLAGVASGNGK